MSFPFPISWETLVGLCFSTHSWSAAIFRVSVWKGHQRDRPHTCRCCAARSGRAALRDGGGPRQCRGGRSCVAWRRGGRRG